MPTVSTARYLGEISSMAPKIFGIGLSRTGTVSLHEALIGLGYTSVHFPGSLEVIEHHDAATDTPVAAYFETLDREYPHSKFILTVRDLDPWLASMKWLLEDVWCFQGTPDQSQWHPFIGPVHDLLYGTRSFDPQKLTLAREQHTQRVLSYFSSRPGDLLVIDITRGEGWERLCPFLQKGIPAHAFPSSHRRNPA